MNRRTLLKAGMISIGGMVIPLKSLFALDLDLDDPRSLTVKGGLTQVTKKPYEQITEADLLGIQELKLPHIHITSFLENDFKGLTNLKTLGFFSVFHSVPALPETVFRGLEGLETLLLEQNQYNPLPDDVFTPLENLKVLNLRVSEFDNMPKSIFKLKTLEAVYTQGLDPTHEDMLKQQYGSIVKPKP